MDEISINLKENQSVIAQSDKTVLKIFGLKIRGLNTRELETLLADKLQSVVRIIGVTGESLELDVYGADPRQIYRDEASILRAVSLCEGIEGAEVAKISQAERIVEVEYSQLSGFTPTPCKGERWQ
ncbi:MAG: hypothetical protein RR998_07385 [Oscillospiraceae bacterium]